MRSSAAVMCLTLAAALANAQPAAKNFVTHMSGDEEVPVRTTDATGQSFFQLAAEGHALAFRIIVANIHNVVAAHIHLGPAGANGPVVAFLYGPAMAAGGRLQGVIGEGLITAADLVGPLSGEDLEALIDAMRSGNTYVNVHTNDGVAPTDTGPGDFPGGEIRGQIRAAGPSLQP
jgi:hypothetical protein